MSRFQTLGSARPHRPAIAPELVLLKFQPCLQPVNLAHVSLHGHGTPFLLDLHSREAHAPSPEMDDVGRELGKLQAPWALSGLPETGKGWLLGPCKDAVP